MGKRISDFGFRISGALSQPPVPATFTESPEIRHPKSEILFRKFGLCIAVVACQLFAQTNSGRISGTVTDSSGAVISGASVIITNQGTALKWKAATNASGFYVVTNLPVGGYSVEIERAGFRKAQKTGLDLADAARLTADFKLELGSVT